MHLKDNGKLEITEKKLERKKLCKEEAELSKSCQVLLGGMLKSKQKIFRKKLLIIVFLLVKYQKLQKKFVVVFFWSCIIVEEIQ